jgi:hypothetical protein
MSGRDKPKYRETPRREVILMTRLSAIAALLFLISCATPAPPVPIDSSDCAREHIDDEWTEGIAIGVVGPEGTSYFCTGTLTNTLAHSSPPPGSPSA